MWTTTGALFVCRVTKRERERERKRERERAGPSPPANFSVDLFLLGETRYSAETYVSFTLFIVEQNPNNGGVDGPQSS